MACGYLTGLAPRKKGGAPIFGEDPLDLSGEDLTRLREYLAKPNATVAGAAAIFDTDEGTMRLTMLLDHLAQPNSTVEGAAIRVGTSKSTVEKKLAALRAKASGHLAVGGAQPRPVGRRRGGDGPTQTRDPPLPLVP